MCLRHVVLTKIIHFLNPTSANVENKTLFKKVMDFSFSEEICIMLSTGRWEYEIDSKQKHS